MDTDFFLIQKMKRGDEYAFDLFVRKYYEEILRYCRYHCADLSYAEDLTQETFLRFFEGFSHYRHMGKARNYLYTIAGNLCRDYYRKTRERTLKERGTEEEAENQSSTGIQESEKILNELTIETALAALPHELREVVILHYFQERKLAEIAGILQIGLPLVKYRIRQAKLRLEQVLKEE